ncbi:GMC family oxidoreductase [Amycolatopsis pigmentata]|uniref:GMC family oxidoreductase n=1 Tax=Amycolatopsis pigmentata TaxID=450801 RepID=A0ABW5G3Z4_9PSEU
MNAGTATVDAAVVVVGGGTAGAIVASRIAERGDRSVVLLEAGPDFGSPEETPPILRYGGYSEGRVTTRDYSWKWDTVLTAEGGTPYTLHSGKVIGGGSSVNGQVWLRGLADDFDDNWAGRGATEWTWEQVAPWYAATEADQDFPAHGDHGPVAVSRVAPGNWHPLHAGFVDMCLAKGFPLCPDFNADGATGVGPQPFNNVDGVRLSSAFTHLSAVRGRPTVRVVGDHEVVRILFDHDRAVGVVARGPSGHEVIVRAEQEVVLAAGALGTPWLLLRSGVGPAGQLRRHGLPVVADLPGVGRSLREHPQVCVRWRARPGQNLDQTSARAPVALRWTAPGSTLRDDMKLSIAAFEDGGGTGIQASVFLMQALSAGSVTLAPEGPDARPVVDLAFLDHPEDLRRMREAVRLTVDLVESSAELRPVIGERVDPDDDEMARDAALDAWLRRKIQGTFHPSSTCAIGSPDAPGTVVNQEGEVRGVHGLRVVDASVMPDSVRANLNATVAMMAERFASAITG